MGKSKWITRFKQRYKQWKKHPLSTVGPGIITGVADDDPSGIATYSQAGAQYGLNMLWTMPLCFPLMSAVQLMCARIGRVTGKGLAANIREIFPASILRIVVVLLLIANTLNIAADVAAMGEAAELVTGIDRHFLTIFFVFLSISLQIWVPYNRYVGFLKWLTLSLVAYIAVLFTVQVPWGEVVQRSFLPNLEFNAESATVLLAVFGTTISPYLFFWQASQEVEDMLDKPGAKALLLDKGSAKMEFRRIKWDTWTGMFYSNIIAYIIILATGVTLHPKGVTDIQTAADAANALAPLAGSFASLIFAIGIVGVGLIGVPVLAGSAAYAFSEAMGWKWGLFRKPKEALGFYAVLGISVLSSLLIQYSPINPIKALFWSAVINGVVAAPVMILVIVLATSKRVMGPFTENRFIVALACIATLLMAIATVGMFVF